MAGSETLAALRASRRFAAWDDASLRGLLRFFDEGTVRAGERLAVEGAPCHEFLIVVAGRLETCAGGLGGVLGPGDSFGWAAMERRGMHEAGLVALTDARVLVMSHEQFRAALAPPGPRLSVRRRHPAARECVMPAPPASVRRKHTATHIR